MARTVRRTRGDQTDLKWALTKLIRVDGCRWYMRVDVDPQSAEAKRIISKYHSDSARLLQWRGPRWWRNQTAERPLRRESKRQLSKYMLDSEYEVILRSKNRLGYWL